jgi:hypothetical protein
MKINIGQSLIEVDSDATREAYRKLLHAGPEECGCSYCRNWVAARPQVYGEEISALLESMGIRPGYETEVWEVPWDDGRHYYGGWYPFIGSVLTRHEAPAQLGKLELTVSPGLSYDLPWIQADRAQELHFSAVIDWLLSEPPETEPGPSGGRSLRSRP